MANPTPEQARAEIERRDRARAEIERREAAAASLPPPGSGVGDPVEAARLRQEAVEGAAPPPGMSLERPVRAVGAGVRRGAEGTMGTPGAVLNLAANVPGLSALRNPYGFEGARERLDFALGPETFEPEGRVEEALRLTGEFVPGVGAAGLARRATIGGTSTLGSIGRTVDQEMLPLGASIAAQQATFGSDLQPFAEAGAGLIGGVFPSAGRVLESRAEMGIRQRLNLDGMSRQEQDQMFRSARRVSEIADEIGFPITPDEALQNDSLRRLAAGLMQSDQGAELRASRLARADVPGRGPGTFRDAVENQIIQALVETRTPVVLARQAGQRGIEELRRARSTATRPYYEAASRPDQAVDVTELAKVDDLIQTAINAQPQGSPALSRLEALQTRITRGNRKKPDWSYEANPGTLDLAYREFREVMNLPTGDPGRLRGTEINALRAPLEALHVLTGQNPNIARGREVHRAFTIQERMDPVRGPLAILAQNDTNAAERLETLAESILNAGDVDPREVTIMVNRLANPRIEGGRDAIEGLFRGYLSSLVDKSTQIRPRGAQTSPSAVFAASLQGNSRRNFNAFLDALDQADQRAGLPRANRRLAFENLMEVMDTTIGPAPAAQRNLTADDMVGVAGNQVRRVLSTFRPLMTPAAVLSQNVSERINQSRLREGWDAIAGAMSATGPEGVDAIRRMADAGRTGPAAARAMVELLAVRGQMLDFDEREPEE